MYLLPITCTRVLSHCINWCLARVYPSAKLRFMYDLTSDVLVIVQLNLIS